MLPPLATLSAWPRVYDDAHWTSDVVAGAVIGVAGARTTVQWLRCRSARAEADGAAAGAAVPIVLIRFPLGRP